MTNTNVKFSLDKKLFVTILFVLVFFLKLPIKMDLDYDNDRVLKLLRFPEGQFSGKVSHVYKNASLISMK